MKEPGKLLLAAWALVGAAAVALGGCGRVGYDLVSERRATTGGAGNGGQSGSNSEASAAAGGVRDAGPNNAPGGSGNAAGGSGNTAGGSGNTAGGSGGGVTNASDASSLDAALDAADATPRMVCGDGTVQAGEACDDRAASATCNADCTFSSCGDGKVDKVAGEACDDGDHLASCGATCSAVACRAGCTCEWYLGRRYMLCPDKITYTAARTACVSSGMRLVRLTSGEEHSFLRLRSQQDGYAKFHIGATDTAKEGAWLWDDGTQFWSGGPMGTAVAGNFAAWAAGEPNNQNGDENCAEVQSIQGFNDSVCDLESKPFICKQYRDPRPQCGNGRVDPGEACDAGKATAACDADCSPVVCGDGIVNTAAGEVCDDGASGQYCAAGCKQVVCPTGCRCFTVASSDYALCTNGASFQSAEVFCGKHGMALATVESAAVDQALRTQATNASVSEYWVGGTDLDAEGQWMWLDTTHFWSGAASGKATSYAHFASTAPGGGATANCLHVTGNGQWTDADCTTSFAYVCKRVVP